MQNTMLDSIVLSHSQELSNASSALRLFENPQFRVRVIMRCAEPWFVAKDACDCLTLTDTNKACQNLDDDENQVVTRDFDPELFSESKAQAITLVSESGLYTLIMRSNKPEAKVFRKWEYQRISRLQDFANVKSLGDDGEIGLPEISGRRINIEDSWRNFALSK